MIMLLSTPMSVFAENIDLTDNEVVSNEDIAIEQEENIIVTEEPKQEIQENETQQTEQQVQEENTQTEEVIDITEPETNTTEQQEDQENITLTDEGENAWIDTFRENQTPFEGLDFTSKRIILGTESADVIIDKENVL